jgi:hypothetical protein
MSAWENCIFEDSVKYINFTIVQAIVSEQYDVFNIQMDSIVAETTYLLRMTANKTKFEWDRIGKRTDSVEKSIKDIESNLANADSKFKTIIKECKTRVERMQSIRGRAAPFDPLQLY